MSNNEVFNGLFKVGCEQIISELTEAMNKLNNGEITISELCEINKEANKKLKILRLRFRELKTDKT